MTAQTDNEVCALHQSNQAQKLHSLAKPLTITAKLKRG